MAMVSGSAFSPGVAIAISAATHKGQDKLARNAQAMIHTLQRHFFRYESKPRTGYEARQTRVLDRGSHHLIFSSNATYGPWLEGVGSRNYPVTRFPGYHIYRLVAQQIDHDAKATVEPFIREACNRLNR